MPCRSVLFLKETGELVEEIQQIPQATDLQKGVLHAPHHERESNSRL